MDPVSTGPEGPPGVLLTALQSWLEMFALSKVQHQDQGWEWGWQWGAAQGVVISNLYRRLGGGGRFPCFEPVNTILWGFARARAAGSRVLFILFSLLFVDLIYFPPTKGPVAKDISCRWVMDDSLLFSVCALWFYLLCFKGPKQCVPWDLITGISSAQRTNCELKIFGSKSGDFCLTKESKLHNGFKWSNTRRCLSSNLGDNDLNHKPLSRTQKAERPTRPHPGHSTVLSVYEITPR